MTANAKIIKPPKARLPTLEDVRTGKVTFDNYESAHGEDIPEGTAEQFARSQPMREMFPEIIEAFERMRGERGPQKAPVKERIGLRLDAEIVGHFRATGSGWQSRINEILKSHIATQGKSK